MKETSLSFPGSERLQAPGQIPSNTSVMKNKVKWMVSFHFYTWLHAWFHPLYEGEAVVICEPPMRAELSQVTLTLLYLIHLTLPASLGDFLSFYHILKQLRFPQNMPLILSRYLLCKDDLKILICYVLIGRKHNSFLIHKSMLKCKSLPLIIYGWVDYLTRHFFVICFAFLILPEIGRGKKTIGILRCEHKLWKTFCDQYQVRNYLKT